MKSGTGIERWERPMDEATRISLKDQFNSLLVRAIEGRRGGMALMRVLEELDFYNSPASAKHHLNVPGGLVLHSLNVARAALELCDKMPQFAKCNKDAVLTPRYSMMFARLGSTSKSRMAVTVMKIVT